MSTKEVRKKAKGRGVGGVGVAGPRGRGRATCCHRCRTTVRGVLGSCMVHSTASILAVHRVQRVKQALIVLRQGPAVSLERLSSRGVLLGLQLMLVSELLLRVLEEHFVAHAVVISKCLFLGTPLRRVIGLPPRLLLSS